ncbi:RecQ type DNA helicase Hrq1 [Schizosaccharomyces japonicus yFS275]|uniref:RecQ type DNA helicase Hrq1 n=1 Tax=Schizosaccharomyces japonicus (strain yFS275 / FY16936) TaxID=402676 RepID=B6K1T8_SCHJY|nr:RecQ type DNA helicase Hrq1 [Schizosaccharomyces japonicus yFS275]EEB07119.1 RecQ type DNA helicase Hrq1 [Schizosaccharomyces japonicus yFS275]
MKVKREDNSDEDFLKASANSKKRKVKSNLEERSINTQSSGTGGLCESFKKIYQLFQFINTTYTFLNARNCLIITFPMLESAYKSAFQKDLTITDLVKLQLICPKLVNFQYKSVEGLALAINKNTQAKEIFDGLIEGQTYILVFELSEGNKGKGRGGHNSKNPTMKSQIHKQLLSIDYLKKVIKKRNLIFEECLNNYYDRLVCTKKDPDSELDREANLHIPISPTDFDDSVSVKSEIVPLQTKPETIDEILDLLRGIKDYENQIVDEGTYSTEAKACKVGFLSKQLSQELIDALYSANGIKEIYEHQALAINWLWERHNVIVSTATSSGKSLVYQLPILHDLQNDPETTALIVFPTKALAQDQKRSLQEVLSYMPSLSFVQVETFDGDTPIERRENIIEKCNIIFTNPDMLHQTILPRHDKWYRFLKNLRYFILDEIHVYNGIFGVHVSFILRRLRRLCCYLGNDNCRFVSCSATINDPQRHMQTIIGTKDVSVVDFTASPCGEKLYVMWNPPYTDPSDPSKGRKSALHEASKLFILLVERNVRTIVFCRVRKSCETLMQAVLTELKQEKKDHLIPKIQSYRAGYTLSDRRLIEKKMFDGELLGIIATNALELGIDIGSLDAVVTLGFPYSISNLKQQFGRAGRRNKLSLAVYVVETFPMDQYYLQHPEDLRYGSKAELTVDLSNELLLSHHLQCAASEFPVNPETDSKFFGSLTKKVAREKLLGDEQGLYHPHPSYLPYPATQVKIRNISEDMYTLVDVTNGQLKHLEDLEPFRVALTAYEGAVYIYQGRTFIIRNLDIDRRRIEAQRVDVDWITAQRDYTDVDPTRTFARFPLFGGASQAYFGNVRAALHVFGYFKINKKREIIDTVDIVDKPVIIDSKGFWIDVPWHIIELLSWKKINGAASIHAAEHALLSLMPLYISNGGNDIRTECKAGEKEFKQSDSQRRRPARLIYYDDAGDTAGAGLCQRAVLHLKELMSLAIERLESCQCTQPEGCVQCITTSKFAGGTCSGEVLDKHGAYILLKMLMGQSVNLDKIPDGPEPDEAHAIRTLIPFS